MNPPLIQLRGVAKHFGSKAVLQGLDWQVGAGQVVGLLGRNGAGKSTLLECLLGLRETDAGSALLYGEPVDRLSDATRARIGYVPQKAELFGWMTPVQLLDYFKALYPRWNGPKVEALLERWGFDPLMRAQPIHRLSGGEQQRLSIIRALAHDPELLVLDEPVSALDPAGRRAFLAELVDGVIERGTTVVFSTHILTDLERVALDVAFLKDGRISLQGGLDELLEGARQEASVTGGRGEALSLEDLFIEVTR
ncbi:ABC transporter ATP-binding protein [Massilia sp. ST3]|uniref:ABC transporter ATP-binding protein n=1 Tax=Massilia sp. ST3 TaxID=2824903 RepID=UPI001B810135|nr:ABC transporter ATP-binding protein [Massilia sp. ST3]